jgi:IS6 family transposase
MSVNHTAVRWYLRYRLSRADVRDLLAKRDVDVSARAILSWAHGSGPLLAAARRRRARPCGRRWWVDETDVGVAGRWAYRYRAVDEAGQVVDVLLRAAGPRACPRLLRSGGFAARRSPEGGD